jgi:hypothetical protein
MYLLSIYILVQCCISCAYSKRHERFFGHWVKFLHFALKYLLKFIGQSDVHDSYNTKENIFRNFGLSCRFRVSEPCL